MFTDYHSKLLAHELALRRPADSDDRLANAVASAQVDLNPHQVDAALFAFRSPLSKGVLLADEVRLGKTIEAGANASAFDALRARLRPICQRTLRRQVLAYVPYTDFVAETDQQIILLETKAANVMDSDDVKLKRDAAVTWCGRASEYSSKHGRKPWQYVLIPHNVIAENMTLDALVRRYAVK